MAKWTNLVERIVFEDEEFKIWNNWQREDKTINVILKAQERERNSDQQKISAKVSLLKMLKVYRAQ